MKKYSFLFPLLSLIVLASLAFGTLQLAPPSQTDDPEPPDDVIKLIFIHHSSGENWLADDNGGLGLALSQNNYFVSDTNYGWGPDSIGDRTDIPNWLEWFRSDQTPTYMDALFGESDQHTGPTYTRLLDDPGGENMIIMFKSCFPNSDLEGNPDDPAAPEGDALTVANAKYVYTQLLEYFATRPDKLFIVITAPPLRADQTTPEHAANARAFNDWLVYDWLSESDYPYPNVAVFDFFNVLTGPKNHHWFTDGQIVHITIPGKDTSSYSIEDGHPSAKGNRKATEEFIPLLSVYYHRWAEASSDLPPAATESEPPSSETLESAAPPASGMESVLADFDLQTPSVESFWDEATTTQINCAPAEDEAHGGSFSLKIAFDVASGSWSTCVLSFDSLQDWSSSDGLLFFLHSDQVGLPYNVLLYAGSPENKETYVFYSEAADDSLDGWAQVQITWDEFLRADWEADGGSPFEKADQVNAFAFGFDGLADSAQTGTVWVDDVQLTGMTSAEPEETEKGIGLPCLGAILPLVLALIIMVRVRR